MPDFFHLFRAFGFLLGLLAAGCISPESVAIRIPTATSRPPVSIPDASAAFDPAVIPATPLAFNTPAPTSTPSVVPTSTSAIVPSPSAKALMMETEAPLAVASPTPTIWPTVTLQVLSADVAAGLVPCANRIVSDDLLTVVTQQFGLPESFTPPNLVPLADYFAAGVTVGIPSTIRADLIEPLRHIIDAMHADGLSPSILSGYRSYSEQYLAWKWWNSQYPERVAIMSARAGHSEHQLGTTVDFGSPELDHLFHVDFAQTSEGLWLIENAHRYGFTISYPADSYAITGFKYEPWHFRYVGPELATELHDSGQILTEWQLGNLPPPCIPSP